LIDNTIIFNNPLIPEGYYYAKVISTEQEQANFKYPKLLIKLKLHRIYGIIDDDTLASIIYPTEKSLFHYKNFIRSFIIYNDDLSFGTIPDVYGTIQVSRVRYEDTVYSSVKFVYMPRWAMMEAIQLTRQDEEDGYVEVAVKKPISK